MRDGRDGYFLGNCVTLKSPVDQMITERALRACVLLGACTAPVWKLLISTLVVLLCECAYNSKKKRWIPQSPAAQAHGTSHTTILRALLSADFSERHTRVNVFDAHAVM